MMGDALARLQSKREVFRNLGCPLAQHVFPGQPVEGVVDFDRRKFAGIVAKHAVVLQIRRVEIPLPLLERVAARSGENLHEALRLAFTFSGFSFSRLALSASIRSMIFASPPTLTSAVMSWPSTLD